MGRTILWGPEVSVDGLEWLSQGMGLQADMSVRGSDFRGVGVALGGLALRQPQTEHFQSELPAPMELFLPAEVVTGPDQRLASAGHLVGSVSLDFAPVRRTRRFALGLGEEGNNRQSLFLSAAVGAGDPWAYSAFAWHESLAGGDHGHNRGDRAGGGLHLQRRTGTDSLDALAAYQEKAFGARGFYGASASWPASERTEDALLLFSWRHDLAAPDTFLRLAAATRRFGDDYVLDDRLPSLYRNLHRTLVSSVAGDGRLGLDGPLFLNWRLAAEDERIASHGVYNQAATEGLGRHDRQRLSLMLLPECTSPRWTFMAGADAVLLDAAAAELLTLGSAEYRPHPGHALRLGYAEAVRQPSFTELDYESPSSLGDRGLDNETAAEMDIEMRSRWSGTVRTRVALFRRITRNTVDWGRPRGGERWLAADVGTVITEGFELTAETDLPHHWTIAAFYRHLARDGRSPHASRYVFDFQQHRAGLELAWQPRSGWALRLHAAPYRFARNPARGGGRGGVDSSLNLTIPLPVTHRAPGGALLRIRATNLLDEGTQVFPGQKRAGRHVMAELILNW
ncbi:MAG: TonB-dependent receptor [Lentisphaeria bacterium]|nr:TonB-dependent receptor [Lentisphaeria bacterium]